MSDVEPTAAGKPNGGFIVMGVLAAVGLVLWFMQPEHESAAPVVDAGVEVMQFDLATDPHFNVGVALRPMDKDIFAAMQDPTLARERMTDVFPDRPYKVRLIGNGPEHKYQVVVIDLDRDGKREERWDLKPGSVTRTVPRDPNAPDSPTKYTLAHGRWQLH